MAYLDLLNSVARVVGGTQPDPTGNPYWFSGREAGDSTGVPGLVGCWSFAPESLTDTPVAMVLPGPRRPLEGRPMQGHKFIEDETHVRVLVGHDDLQAQMVRLVGFRESVESAFDGHMQLFGQPNVLTAGCAESDFLEVDWGGNTYLALVFFVRVQMGVPVTYVG